MGTSERPEMVESIVKREVYTLAYTTLDEVGLANVTALRRYLRRDVSPAIGFGEGLDTFPQNAHQLPAQHVLSVSSWVRDRVAGGRSLRLVAIRRHNPRRGPKSGVESR